MGTLESKLAATQAALDQKRQRLAQLKEEGQALSQRLAMSSVALVEVQRQGASLRPRPAAPVASGQQQRTLALLPQPSSLMPRAAMPPPPPTDAVVATRGPNLHRPPRAGPAPFSHYRAFAPLSHELTFEHAATSAGTPPSDFSLPAFYSNIATHVRDYMASTAMKAGVGLDEVAFFSQFPIEVAPGVNLSAHVHLSRTQDIVSFLCTVMTIMSEHALLLAEAEALHDASMDAAKQRTARRGDAWTSCTARGSDTMLQRSASGQHASSSAPQAGAARPRRHTPTASAAQTADQPALVMTCGVNESISVEEVLPKIIETLVMRFTDSVPLPALLKIMEKCMQFGNALTEPGQQQPQQPPREPQPTPASLKVPEHVASQALSALARAVMIYRDAMRSCFTKLQGQAAGSTPSSTAFEPDVGQALRRNEERMRRLHGSWAMALYLYFAHEKSLTRYLASRLCGPARMSFVMAEQLNLDFYRELGLKRAQKLELYEIWSRFNVQRRRHDDKRAELVQALSFLPVAEDIDVDWVARLAGVVHGFDASMGWQGAQQGLSAIGAGDSSTHASPPLHAAPWLTRLLGANAEASTRCAELLQSMRDVLDKDAELHSHMAMLFIMKVLDVKQAARFSTFKIPTFAADIYRMCLFAHQEMQHDRVFGSNGV